MYLTLHTTYTHVEVALCEQGAIIDARYIDKYDASRLLVSALDELCAEGKTTLSAMTCIVTHEGPGPFTTLRASLATANGLAAATNIKLVGVDGLRAFVAEHHTAEYPVTVALLNAYSNDLYYAIEQHDTLTTGIVYGTRNLENVLKNLPDTTLRFTGNGVLMHEKTINALCGARAHFPQPMPETCSLRAVVKMGWNQWLEQKNVRHQLAPLYVKAYDAPTINQKMADSA